MEDKEHFCTACKVDVAADLSFCPLCGKYLLNDDERVYDTHESFPKYDYSDINRGKWVRIVTNLLWYSAIICLFINIIFTTKPLWFPYALASLYLFYIVFISPFKKNNNFFKSMVKIGVAISLFVIFIDFYNFKCFGFAFGWSFAFVAPCLLSAFTLGSSVLCLSIKKYDIMHLYGVFAMMILSIIYFLIKCLAFNSLSSWPSVMYVCSAVGCFIILLTFKYKAFAKEFAKKFRI